MRIFTKPKQIESSLLPKRAGRALLRLSLSILLQLMMYICPCSYYYSTIFTDDLWHGNLLLIQGIMTLPFCKGRAGQKPPFCTIYCTGISAWSGWIQHQNWRDPYTGEIRTGWSSRLELWFTNSPHKMPTYQWESAGIISSNYPSPWSWNNIKIKEQNKTKTL